MLESCLSIATAKTFLAGALPIYRCRGCSSTSPRTPMNKFPAPGAREARAERGGGGGAE